jgi:hypothetical protein
MAPLYYLKTTESFIFVISFTLATARGLKKLLSAQHKKVEWAHIKDRLRREGEVGEGGGEVAHRLPGSLRLKSPHVQALSVEKS